MIRYIYIYDEKKKQLTPTKKKKGNEEFQIQVKKPIQRPKQHKRSDEVVSRPSRLHITQITKKIKTKTQELDDMQEQRQR